MGKIRITGMNSGLDTDAMVRELVNAYEKQGEKYSKAKTKTEWKQEAWMTLNGKIKNFFSAQEVADRYSPIDPEGLQALVDNTDISEATRGKIQQTIDTGDISYIASDASVMEELNTWSANYVDLGLTVINQLNKVNAAATTAATLAESDSEGSEED